MSVKQYKVPAKFWDDHCDRCPCDGDPEVAMAQEVSRSGYRVLIEGTDSQIECLLTEVAQATLAAALIGAPLVIYFWTMTP